MATALERPFRILVIEDNHDLAANIGDFLESRGHTLDFALDGLTGLHLATVKPLDVIVLDLALPGLDGLEVCQRLRRDAQSTIPILMLTARDTLEEKLAGFEAGADDYLVKPFAMKELDVRLRALVRRSLPEETSVLQSGVLRLDTGQRKVTLDGKSVDLNRTGFCILAELMRRSPEVVTREDLEHVLWGDMPPGSDALRSHIYGLRKALGNQSGHNWIETVYGVGFRMQEFPS